MRNGLYGKLPTKRDFIALSASGEFLSQWEAWMQGGVSASTLRLGNAWRSAFLRAPIWRFWLGAELCGETILGAFMPSLDAIGRYFPLTIFVRSGIGSPLPPPEFEPQSVWFEAAENLLLSTLDPGATYEGTVSALARLEPPRDRMPPFAQRGGTTLSDGSVLIAADQDAFADIFASARMVDHVNSYAASTFWWTVGGEGFAPVTLTRRRMPDPYVFTSMLTGNFSPLLA